MMFAQSVTSRQPKNFDRTGRPSAVLLGLAACCFAAISSIFILHPFTPSFPQSGLDPSWSAVTGEAGATRARWGTDIIFTYGPASPLATNYFNADYFWRTLPLLVAFSLIHGVCAAVLLTMRRPGTSLGTIPLIAVLCYAFALISARQNPDTFYFCSVFLVFFLDSMRNRDDRVALLAVVLGVAAAGIFCLSKLSYALSVVPLFFLGDLRALVLRRPPFRLATSGAVFVAAYLAYGQHLNDLPRFIMMQKEIIAGYTEAMSLGGSSIEYGAYLAVAAMLLAMLLILEWTREQPWPLRLPLPIGVGIFLVLVFKAGFVRHDLHSLTAWISLGFVGLMIGFCCVVPRWPRSGAVTIVASLLILGVVYPCVVIMSEDAKLDGSAMIDVYRDWLSDGPPDELAAMQEAIVRPASFAAAQDKAKSAAWAEIRKNNPLPNLSGSIDVIQSEQTNLIANSLDYKNRPVFQEYSTYTPALIQANEAFFESDRGPEWVLFSPGSIDNRFPSFVEGPIWPDFIRLYEPVLRINNEVALHRRSKPADDILGVPRTRTARLGEFVALDADGPVFARIVVKPTLFGRVMALLFRPSLFTMRLRLRSGEERSYRFIPALGAAGFVLSPVISSSDEFTRMALGGLQGVSRRDVLDVKIVGAALSQYSSDPEVTYQFTPLVLDHIAHSALAEPMYRSMLKAISWQHFVVDRGLGDKIDGDRLSLQPPNSLVIPIRGARHLKVGFGLENGAWNTGRTKGVCFALKQKGASDLLWQRCLDPLNIEADRGDQSADVELPPNMDDVVLQTACRESCDWGWAYVNGAEAID